MVPWVALVSARPPTSVFPARSAVARMSTAIRVLATLAVILLFLKHNKFAFSIQAEFIDVNCTVAGQ